MGKAIAKRVRVAENVLIGLTRDCITWRLSEPEAIQYIQQYTKYKPTVGWYRKHKAMVLADPEVNTWLAEHTRIGFVRTHKGLMDELEKVRDKLMAGFRAAEDPKDIDMFTSQILAVNKRIQELNIGMPILAQMKHKLEERTQNEHHADVKVAT